MGQSRRRKIVFLLPQLCAGGAERVLITFVNQIDRKIFQPELVVLSDGPARAWVDPSIPVHDLKALRIRNGVYKLYKKFKVLEPDIVVSTLVHMNALALLIKIFFPKTLFVVREASLPSMLVRSYGLKGRFCWLAYKILYPLADLVICPTRGILEEFTRKMKLPLKSAQVLYNPVDTVKIEKQIVSGFNLDHSHDAVKFISAGRLSFEKGFGLLIEALGSFDLSKDWRWDIWGEGPEREKLEEMIKNQGLQAHIFLRGYSDNPWNEIAGADCLLLPSIWEGMPNAVLEALACGTKVIGNQSAGGITEIKEFSSEGAVFLAGNVQEFLDLMKKCVPQKKTGRASSLLPEEFLLKNVIARFEAMLTEIEKQ